VRHPHRTEYLAECFWPGVSESDLLALDERASASAAELSADGEAVRYIGSLLMREDEVVLCRFEGSEPAVRRVAERAAIPFERILEAGRSPWTQESTASGLEHNGSEGDVAPAQRIDHYDLRQY
jgi:hypothetical protein